MIRIAKITLVSYLYEVLSRMMLFAIYVVFLMAYCYAYSSPQGKIIFDINFFHEKHVEIFLFIVTFPKIVLLFKKMFEELRVL